MEEYDGSFWCDLRYSKWTNVTFRIGPKNAENRMEKTVCLKNLKGERHQTEWKFTQDTKKENIYAFLDLTLEY